MFLFLNPTKPLKMVTVTGYAVRERADGNTFITLELTGGLELVQSQSTGNFYATVRKCSIPSTFDDEDFAESLVGTKMEGEVVRVDAEPYEYTNKQTGEVITLAHTYAYRPKGSVELIGSTQVTEMEGA